MITVILKKGKEKSVLRRHPWVLSGAVERVVGHGEPGKIVRVADRAGNLLAMGFYNPISPIPVRLFSWHRESVEDNFWEQALQTAISLRVFPTLPDKTNACRLVFSESDFMTGLIVDRYNDYLVMQCLNPGMARLKNRITRYLMETLSPRGIYEKSDSDILKLEGLSPHCGILAGATPPETIAIQENGYEFLVNPISGHKTGFYLDQRDNRWITSLYAQGSSVLDAFSYTGGFSVYTAGHGAASLTRIDASHEALSLGEKNLAANFPAPPPSENIRGNVFQVLRKFRDAGRQFDMIILDPPRLAPTRSHQNRASRGYKDINLLAMKLLRPGGILSTFSCSGGIDAATFERIVSWAAVDAKREIQILRRLFQGPDHPVRVAFPEGSYLKGLLCRVL